MCSCRNNYENLILLFYYSYYHYFILLIGCVCIYYIYSNTSIDKYLLVIYGFVRLKYSTWCHIKSKATNSSTWYYIESYVCFKPRPAPRNWQWESVTNETLRQKRWFQFSDCGLSIYSVYIATFHQHLHMEYISLSWYDIPELVFPIMISLIDGCW
jgi:hypothetical protein